MFLLGEPRRVCWYRYLYSVGANGNGDQHSNLYFDSHPRRASNGNTNTEPGSNSDIHEHPWWSGYGNTYPNSRQHGDGWRRG